MDRILQVQMKNKHSVSSKRLMDGILRAFWRRCHPMDGKMKTTSSAFTDQHRLCHRKHCSLQHHHPCFRALINLQPRIRRPRCSSARATGTPVAPTVRVTPYFLRSSYPSANFFALPQDPFPSCLILTFRKLSFVDQTRAFFSSGDYGTILLELAAQYQDFWK